MSAPRRSFQTTGFGFTASSWIGSLVAMFQSADPNVRYWGAVGFVLIPIVYLLCSTLIKRGKLRAPKTAAASMLSLASSVIAPGPGPADPGAP